MPEVFIDDAPRMNALGLFLASAVRGRGPCALRGALAVESDGMRATLVFDDRGATVTRADVAVRATARGSLPALVEAVVRPRLGALLRVRASGNVWFAWRVLRFLAP